MPKIRDNRLGFSISSTITTKYSLIRGEFYVKDLSVTSGQPTDVKVGNTLFCNSNGKFHFRVGRKQSKDVANWFNRQCDTGKNTTFAHPAGELNFAFLGTLRLTISYKHINEHKVTFDDILIAQGQSGSSNNWWFGGKNCYNLGNNDVESKGTTQITDSFRFTFYRGGGASINTVLVKNISFLTWMRNIDDNKFLNEINIPGTHDSATYNFKTPITRDYVQAQNLSIHEQLDLGIRFLDIRCRHIDNTFAIHHASFYVNLNFDDVLAQCTSFLNENPSESVILLIKEEYNPERNTRAFYETFLAYVNKTSDFWYRGETIPSLKDARKKLTLMRRFDFDKDSFGIDCTQWMNNSTFKIIHSDFTLNIQDEYDMSYEKKERSIRALVDSSKKREYRYWYLNYISLAPSFERGSITDTSNFTNQIIYSIATTDRLAFLGLIIMDFPDNQKWLTSDIIDNNNH